MLDRDHRSLKDPQDSGTDQTGLHSQAYIKVEVPSLKQEVVVS